MIPARSIVYPSFPRKREPRGRKIRTVALDPRCRGGDDKHYNRSPELLAEEEVRRYLLDVRERNARGSFKTSHYGGKCVQTGN